MYVCVYVCMFVLLSCLFVHVKRVNPYHNVGVSRSRPRARQHP